MTSVRNSIIVNALVLVLVVLFMVAGPGYYNYLHDEGREQACDQAFGEGSDWVGNAFPGTVCETPSGDTKIIKNATDLPMSPTTFADYLDSIATGIGNLWGTA